MDQLSICVRERAVLSVTKPDVDDNIHLLATEQIATIDYDLLLSVKSIICSRYF